MKKIKRFIYWVLGINKPNLEQTEKLLNEEVSEIKEIQKSVNEIKVIHEEISTKLEACSVPKNKKPLVLNPRLSSNQLRLYLMNNGVLETKEMSRKERQFYAKKIHFLRYNRGMKIVFERITKTYKYYKNGL